MPRHSDVEGDLSSQLFGCDIEHSEYGLIKVLWTWMAYQLSLYLAAVYRNHVPKSLLSI